MRPELKSRDFILRYPRKSDLKAYHRNKNDPMVAKGFVLFKLPYSLKKASKELNEAIKTNELKKRTKEIFVIDVNGEAVGEVGLEDIIPRLKAKIHYWIGKDCRGKGIATEAVRLLTKYAFKGYRLRRIYALARTYNIASVRVLEKAGFRREGVMKKDVLKNGEYYDSYIYAKVI